MQIRVHQVVDEQHLQIGVLAARHDKVREVLAAGRHGPSLLPSTVYLETSSPGSKVSTRTALVGATRSVGAPWERAVAPRARAKVPAEALQMLTLDVQPCLRDHCPGELLDRLLQVEARE